MKRLFNKDVPFITYIIHDKNMKNGRTVTVYKPTQEYYILFELIKFRRLPATFPDIGITVISEGSEPSLSDVSTTQDNTTTAGGAGMTCTEIKLERCPCCGGEARAQFEVYGTWVRVFCVACGLSTMSEPTRNFDPTPAAMLWNKRVEVKRG